MKKALLFLCLLFIPDVANAQVLYQDIYVKENGDLLVKEAIKLDGDYNGLNLSIDFIYPNEANFLYSAEDLEIVKICEATGNNFNMLNNVSNCFTKVDVVNNGDSKVYTITESDYGYVFNLYNSSAISQNAFYLEYTLKNVVLVHDDVAELKLPILNNNFDKSFSEVIVKVNLPEKDDDYRIWAHSTDTKIDGIVERTTESMATVTINNLPSNTPVDIRMAFDTEMVFLSDKTTAIDYFDQILYEETGSHADEDDESDVENEFLPEEIEDLIITFITSFAIGIITFSVAALVLMTVTTWIIFKKANKPGWASIIPIYREYVFLEISGLKGSYVFFALIPIIGTIIYGVYYMISLFKLPVKFGKSKSFGLGLWLLPYVFYPILAFSKCEYNDEESIEQNNVVNTTQSVNQDTMTSNIQNTQPVNNVQSMPAIEVNNNQNYVEPTNYSQNANVYQNVQPVQPIQSAINEVQNMPINQIDNTQVEVDPILDLTDKANVVQPTTNNVQNLSSTIENQTNNNQNDIM